MELKNKSKTELSKSIKEKAFSQEEAKKVLEKMYIDADTLQPPFGEKVAGLMKKRGMTKKWGNRIILDVKKAADLTGLNDNIFKSTMFKPNCFIEMNVVIAISIGFNLGPILTGELLKSAGLDFRLKNPEHLAYIYLLEHCQDKSRYECNEILEYLGVPPTKLLKSYGRGGGGEEGAYNKRK